MGPTRDVVRKTALATFSAALLGCVIQGAQADEAARKAEPSPGPSLEGGKPMKLDEPMSGGMMKDGMMKGDVRKAAEKKQREMKEAMEKEQKAMGGEKAR